MQTLFLVRHGLTAPNKQQRYSGISGVCLSELGREQSLLLKEVLCQESITSLYTSQPTDVCHVSFIFGLPQRLAIIKSGLMEGMIH